MSIENTIEGLIGHLIDKCGVAFYFSTDTNYSVRSLSIR